MTSRTRLELEISDFHSQQSSSTSANGQQTERSTRGAQRNVKVALQHIGRRSNDVDTCDDDSGVVGECTIGAEDDASGAIQTSDGGNLTKAYEASPPSPSLMMTPT